MEHAAAFARHFARLVWLLVHEQGNVDEQKASLRALATMSKEGAVELSVSGSELRAAETNVSATFTGVTDVSHAMTAHGIERISFDAGASPADLLGVARILAGVPVTGDGGAAAEAKRTALGARTVRFRTRPLPGALPDLELGEMLEEEIPVAPTRPRASMATPAGGTPRASGGGIFDQLAASRTPVESVNNLLAHLDRTEDAGVLTQVLDDLVVLAESAAREGKAALVSEICHRIVRREPALTEFDAKRSVVMAVRRLSKPMVLRAVVTQLPRAPERRAELVAVLARAGEDGADALVEQIGDLAQQGDRRVYFDALLELQAGIPALLHMLGDARWFVARNAADLLGEMGAREAEGPLTELLRHDDDRVRRSATGALMRLGTPRAMQAIQDALKDPQPQTRMQAAAALVSRRDVRSAATLVRALDEEKDEEVQAAFLIALGRLGTPDAVQRLLRAVEPEKGLFRKRGTAYRIAAVQGLGEARTAECVEALRELQKDKDDDVRDAASFALARIARQTAGASPSAP